jgi:RNA polymerase sigma-32 factor
MFKNLFIKHDLQEDTEILVHKWQETKDQKYLEEIINRHMHLVKKIAKNYESHGLHIHDLVAEGVLGLFHSLDKFQISKKVKFSTYAFYWIKAKIYLYSWKMRNLIQVHFSSKNSFIFSILKKIKEEKISLEEGIQSICIKEHLKEDQVKKSMKILSQKMQTMHTVFHDKENNHDLTWEDLIENNEYEDMTQDLDFQNFYSIIEDIMLSFTEKQRYIINHRWLTDTPITLDELARKINMSTEGTRKMERRTLDSLRKILTSRIYHQKNYSQQVLHLIFVLNIYLSDNI